MRSVLQIIPDDIHPYTSAQFKYMIQIQTQLLTLFVLQIVTDENHPSTDCATVPRWIEVHQRQKREYQGEPTLRVTDNQDGNNDIINDNDDIVSENEDKR